jgi:hypothetical protein
VATQPFIGMCMDVRKQVLHLLHLFFGCHRGEYHRLSTKHNRCYTDSAEAAGPGAGF